VGRQQLYHAVQLRSPNRYQMTTEKVQPSVPDGMSSATLYSWQTTAGCSITCWSHWEGMDAERWTSGGRNHQHGCVSRAQTASVSTSVLWHPISQALMLTCYPPPLLFSTPPHTWHDAPLTMWLRHIEGFRWPGLCSKLEMNSFTHSGNCRGSKIF